MKKSSVKNKFINDFETNFYQFNGDEIHRNLKQQIRFQNGPFITYQNNYSTKSRGLTILTRVLAALVIVSALVFVGNLVNQRKHVNVDHLFQAANIEYTQEPILASSSYNGEVLGIYKGINEKNNTSQTQYFYYFNEIGKLSKADHLYFVNQTKNIEKVVDKKNNFGNLSELIEISEGDNIEVIIVYENNEQISRYFIAVE